MATSKVERLLNLVICLLATRQFVSADYIRRNVAGYHDAEQSDDAFNRMFERDKTELRDLGIPLITGPTERGGIDGYRINRDSYELPDINLDGAEAAAIAMAAAIWDTPEVSAISQTAVLKLRAAGFDVRADDEIGVSASAQRALGSEQVLAVLVPAIDDGRAVTFRYRAATTSEPATRTLEPWGVVTHRSRWYVVGHDRDRGAVRTFRLSRIAEISSVGGPGEVHMPAGTDLQAIVSATVDSATTSDGRPARIWVAEGRAAGLRRLASSSTPAEFNGESGDELTVEIRSLSTLARMVLGSGADAVVLAPDELRDVVVAGLDRLIGAGG
ncbi:MAG: WYL domain-containing protein [Gordonia sp. (in: high G+C Gram-positive bacteria)]